MTPQLLLYNITDPERKKKIKGVLLRLRVRARIIEKRPMRILSEKPLVWMSQSPKNPAFLLTISTMKCSFSASSQTVCSTSFFSDSERPVYRFH